MKIRERILRIYRDSSLTVKIRLSYILILIPILILLIISIFSMNSGTERYEKLVETAAAAGDFSLEFKKDYDYETYLVIVGNKSPEESGLDTMLEEARTIVAELEKKTDPGDNRDRLISAGKYIENLGIYKARIEDNLRKENQYEANMQIWENDVQVVTGLIHETLMEYIYYEIRDIQANREEYQRINLLVIQSLIIAAIFLALVATLLSYYIPRSITRPIQELSKVTDQVAKGDLTVRNKVQGGVEVTSLSTSLNTMIDKINELLEQVTEEQVQLRKAELELLQSQINPHFLYNTLDTIMWLAEAGERQMVVSMVESLSRFFRTSLNQGKDIVTLREEIGHVSSYLEIQQVRYQDILEYEIDVPEELMEYRVPKITLQPLVENALYHGIKNKRGKGKITVTGAADGNGLKLYVKDNGIGMTPEKTAELNDRITLCPEDGSGGFGLYNVNERIRLKFGEAYGLHLESEPGTGTVAEVRLPI